MAIQEVLDNVLFSYNRGVINNNFTLLDTNKADTSLVLTKTNTIAYSPTSDYHPATKVYVDDGILNLVSTYDPGNIQADAFDRANHIGVQSPSTISQDSSNRFVTDVQISAWDSKEDAIGAKNTAFNRNFGTSAGTVAEGDHTHNKSEVGLSNVDNTSDLNKPVSTAQQAALDGKIDTNPYYIDLAPQSTPPTFQEGLLFYDDSVKVLKVFGENSAISPELGFAKLVRVINKTGSSISKLKAVKSSGIDTTTNLHKIVSGQANIIDNSEILGVTIHDIASDSEGVLIVYGNLRSVDTSGFSVEDELFLSSTVAGDFTTTEPTIKTKIGIVKYSHATNGIIFIDIKNNIVGPKLFTLVDGVPDTYTLTGDSTFETIDNFDTVNNLGIAVNDLTGVFTIPKTGWYKANLNTTFTISSPPTLGYDVVNFRIRNTTTSTTIYEFIVEVPGGFGSSDEMIRSILMPFQVSKDDEIVLQVNSSDNSSDLDFTSFNLHIENIN